MPQQCHPRRRAADNFRHFAVVVSLGLTAASVSTSIASTVVTADKTEPAPSAKAQTKPALPAITIDVDTNGAPNSPAVAPPAAAKGHHGAKAHIQFGDPDFDSFAGAMETAPWIVGLVFLVVGSIFLTPLILLVGIIWYKLRKTRLQNDALLKLAERGVVPAAQIADAVASGTMLAPPAAPLAPDSGFAQAVSARRRAVWSDLRKGVILTTIGLSFVFYSMTDSGSANWVGLLLMFLGIGYIVLWWLEDRHLQQREVPPGRSSGTS